MPHSIADIAQAVGGLAVGDTSILISAAAEPAAAGPDDLALAMNPRYADNIALGRARAAMLWEGADWEALGLKAAVIVNRPRLAMAGMTAVLDPGQAYPKGIDPSAMIEPSAKIGANVTIGPMAYVAAEAEIGDGSIIGPQCYIGHKTRLGRDCVVHSGVRIMARVQIGDRFRANPGVVVGGDGHSFVTPQESTVEQARKSLGAEVTATGQAWVRIHSLGSVLIGDDVELGANCTIDAGTIRPTEVGSGCKIDNLCMVGHNVKIGRDCLFASQVGVAGSTTIGNGVVLAGQVGVNDNISIGDNVVAGGASKIFTKVPAGRVVLGHPAVKMETNLEIYKAQRRLPRLFQQVAELQKAVFKTADND
ncbi:UDP-3-O-(3-hydroxymyristoyl)glucosamine N-acyltransferase [Pseudooceanicola sp. C21-150M6]|uniref:UDP-3-O-(3-hydroxymyristoyl)glucosamine N-acyltransferase n=1 Tax=Pseudooceanicola sp. C21-150M6 TaxID=3434355 RepID=UPI003D7FB476